MRFIETCRHLYNQLLEETHEMRSDFYQKQASLVTRKVDNKYLKAVHSQVLQDVNIRLDKAHTSWVKGLTKKPRFKRRERYNSFTYPQQPGFGIWKNRLRLSKIGQIRMKVHRKLLGEPKRCTIIREIDRWFAAIQVELPDAKKVTNDRPPIGVDLGLLKLAVLSDGTTFDNPDYVKRSAEKIQTLQRSLSRKRPGSRNSQKARVALAKEWRKVKNQRIDKTHKVFPLPR